MPPTKKYAKETIVDTALKIIEKEGFKSINARRIAKELGSSVQPIFKNFTSMEELHDNLYLEMYSIYRSYMGKFKGDDHEYKKMGIAYIKFAKDHPEFFKAIFMQKTDLNAEHFVLADDMGDDIIKAGQKMTGLDYEEQKRFHVKVWIFTHGLACLAATNTIKMDDRETERLLTESVKELFRGQIEGKKEN